MDNEDPKAIVVFITRDPGIVLGSFTVYSMLIVNTRIISH